MHESVINNGLILHMIPDNEDTENKNARQKWHIVNMLEKNMFSGALMSY